MFFFSEKRRRKKLIDLFQFKFLIRSIDRAQHRATARFDIQRAEFDEQKRKIMQKWPRMSAADLKTIKTIVAEFNYGSYLPETHPTPIRYRIVYLHR